MAPQSLKYLVSGPLQKNIANPGLECPLVCLHLVFVPLLSVLGPEEALQLYITTTLKDMSIMLFLIIFNNKVAYFATDPSQYCY